MSRDDTGGPSAAITRRQRPVSGYHRLTIACLIAIALLPYASRLLAATSPAPTLPVATSSAATSIATIDDAGMELTLSAPAQRIISLSPHITEILFMLGAGSRVVGTMAQSNYPDEARQIQRIGDHNGLDIETIVALKPDLIISWPSGNLPRQLQTLGRLGLPLFASDPQRLDDIPRTLQNLGRLTGSDDRAMELVREYQQRLQVLRDRYSNKPTVSVFLQIWPQPLMTVNDQQLLGDVIHLCGGRNVFGDLATLAPRVNTEAVLQANPDVIISTAEGGDDPLSLRDWHRWPALKATRDGHLYGIDPAIISRPTPRILDGAVQMCRLLDQSRQH